MKVMCVRANHGVTGDHDTSRVKVVAVEYVQFSYSFHLDFSFQCAILIFCL